MQRDRENGMTAHCNKELLILPMQDSKSAGRKQEVRFQVIDQAGWDEGCLFARHEEAVIILPTVSPETGTSHAVNMLEPVLLYVHFKKHSQHNIYLDFKCYILYIFCDKYASWEMLFVS